MDSAPQTATPPALGASSPIESPPVQGVRRRARLLVLRPRPAHVALAGVLALSAVLNTNRLEQNGYANIFYSAAVKSMLRSWHNFFFASFDPGGLITVDKPPLALWAQAASAKVFGFSPLSQLLPEAIMGVLAVALLYRLLALRLGPLAGIAGALALAVFPSFVAVSRDTGVDPLLILLMVLACGAGLRAAETGRWRTLLWCAVLVGLAFNTKTLAAYLVVPGIAVAHLLCAPGSISRRVTQLLAAGAVMLAVSFSWSTIVDLTPASKRPYVGSSTNNSELGLTFEYNGFGRVGGQVGGPGRVLTLPGARVPAGHLVRGSRAAKSTASKRPRSAGPAASTVSKPPAPPGEPKPKPIPFGGSAGPQRLFGFGLGDQGAWILPLALFGLLTLALLALEDRAETHTAANPAAGARREPRLATTLVLGGWFLVEAVVLSLSKGIVHPYYVSALAPGAAAMAGAGAVGVLELIRGRRRAWGLVLVPSAVGATVAVQIVLLYREHYMLWFVPLLLIGAAAGVGVVLAVRRLAAPAMALVFCLLLVAPAAYSATTWNAPVEGTFPAAGPGHATGAGGVGVDSKDLVVYRALTRYVRSHGTGSRWPLLTVAANTAAPFILTGLDAGAVGGYSGTDPALDGRSLARLVASRQARYVLLGGEFSTRGGNRATRAVLRACRQLPDEAWNTAGGSALGFVLFDCAGEERALSAA